jgi:hypothetical protein
MELYSYLCKAMVVDMKNQRHLAQANHDINTLCDFIEEYQALTRISPGYINDPVDCDKEGCFI